MARCDTNCRIFQSHGWTDQGQSEVSIRQWQLFDCSETHGRSSDEALRTCVEVSQWAEPTESDHLARCDEGCDGFWNQPTKRKECSPESFLMFVGPRYDDRKTQDQRSRRWKFGKDLNLIWDSFFNPQGLRHPSGNPDRTRLQRLNCRWRCQIHWERKTSCMSQFPQRLHNNNDWDSRRNRWRHAQLRWLGCSLNLQRWKTT